MPVRGKRVRIPQWIFGDMCVLRLDVDAVVPDADPSEPCLEPNTLRYLDELQELASTGNVTELEKHGVVYVRRSA